MKRVVLLLLILWIPAKAQEGKLSVPYTRFVLPNGLNVILHEDHSIPHGVCSPL